MDDTIDTPTAPAPGSCKCCGCKPCTCVDCDCCSCSEESDTGAGGCC